jgi:hypothetical protein
MDTTKIRTAIFVAAIFFCVIAAPVQADWDPGDSYKMHSPQLPDPDGLDISNHEGITEEPLPLADNWLCTETGLVTDIHIWGSWMDDFKGEIEFFNVSIWSNDHGTNFSHPGKLLWQHTFNQSEFYERYWGTGSQGWAEFASTPTGTKLSVFESNHNDTYQYNLHIDPALAFEQKEGTIYWLAISANLSSSGYRFGWKTSLNEWQGAFVAYTPYEHPEFLSQEGLWLTPPGSTGSLAFVIDGPPLAPEVPLLTPTGVISLVSLLSAIAAVTLTRRKRR